ncbi:hypothetical protein J3E73DRAFT_340677, partial [Bipolaris maydis]
MKCWNMSRYVDALADFVVIVVAYWATASLGLTTSCSSLFETFFLKLKAVSSFFFVLTSWFYTLHRSHNARSILQPRTVYPGIPMCQTLAVSFDRGFLFFFTFYLRDFVAASICVESFLLCFCLFFSVLVRS